MRNTRILVVDDEHLIRWSLEQSLMKQGYDVATAASGEDAIKQVHDEAPELVLLDIQLPGIDGLEVLQKIKEIDSEIIVVMVTALGVLETAIKAMRLGAHDYINKPFNLDELSIIVKKALETRRLRLETLRREVEETNQTTMQLRLAVEDVGAHRLDPLEPGHVGVFFPGLLDGDVLGLG